MEEDNKCPNCGETMVEKDGVMVCENCESKKAASEAPAEEAAM